jgi:hypothetical protein
MKVAEYFKDVENLGHLCEDENPMTTRFAFAQQRRKFLQLSTAGQIQLFLSCYCQSHIHTAEINNVLFNIELR